MEVAGVEASFVWSGRFGGLICGASRSTLAMDHFA